MNNPPSPLRLLWRDRLTNFLCLNLLLLGATALGMDPSFASSLASSRRQEAMADRSAGQVNSEKQLFDAVVCGWPEEVEKLIAQGTSVEVEDSYGSTPLILAAVNGHEDICRLLIVHGALIEAQNNYGWTPLIWAASRGHMNVCRLLIANKALAAAKDIDGWTPLIWAVRNRHKEVGKLLINAQLESIRKDEAAIITLLGISKKRQAKLSCHMPYDIAKIIARQALATVQQSKRLVIEQVNEIGNPEARAAWLVYANEQMNSVNK
jgi:ankyrin repeat protein